FGTRRQRQMCIRDRAWGVRSGIPLSEAARLCPVAVFVPCHSSRYFDHSARILALLLRRTPLVEMASIDEAFLDASGIVGRGGLAEGEALAASIQNEIHSRLRLTCSIGIGPNKLLAKTASGLRKPRGRTVLDIEGFRSRLGPEPVEALYGVGRATGGKLRRMGITTVSQLASAPEGALRAAFGVWGPVRRAAARGEDDSPVVPHHATPEAKSLGHEYTLPKDERDRRQLRRLLLGLSEEVGFDLRSEGWRGGTVHLKLRWSDFRTIGRQTKLARPTDATRDLYRVSCALLEAIDTGEPVRLLGLSVSDLQRSGLDLGEVRSSEQQELFDEGKESALESAADRIRGSFGRGSIRRASLLAESRSPARRGSQARQGSGSEAASARRHPQPGEGTR
ncbi:MAG: DNA polymerase IV, partial [Candidatus Eisenbacteria bacterium]|nr:DNA polymerase IV [Candidatus Eisenbacteria bacterium]